MRNLTLVLVLTGASCLTAAEPGIAPAPMGPPAPAAAPIDPLALAAANDLLVAIPADKVYEAGLLTTFENGIGDSREHTPDDMLATFNSAIDDSKALILKRSPWSGNAAEVAQHLASHLSADEIKQLKAFLATPAGQKAIGLLPELISAEMVAQQHRIIAAMPEVQELVAKKMSQAQQAQVLAHLPPGVAMGKPFPEVAGTAIDGRAVSLQGLKGKVVLIDFWATWCGPCMHAMPELIEDYKGLHDQGFEIIGVSLDEDQAKLTQLVKDQGIPWPQLFDGKGWDSVIATRFHIQSIPASFLIGRDGNLVAVDATSDLLVDAIKKAEAAK
jgi:thiol-disulfide isomerase/thioredoxin